MIYEFLLIDACFSHLGIPIIYKCNCCVEGHIEDNDHVLSTGLIVIQV